MNKDNTLVWAAAKYQTELARFSTWIFSGLVVAMTFLLLAGLRNPHQLLLVFMYVALGAFALTILLYPLANLWSSQLVQASQEVGKKLSKEDEAAIRSQQTRVNVLQIVQQVLFLIGVVAAVGFAIEVSLYFFVSTQAPTPGASAAQAQ